MTDTTIENPPATNSSTESFSMTKEQIKHMVDRFLQWKLPSDFHPDCGIHFDADEFVKLNPLNRRLEPFGTSLFTSTQAKEMVEFMIDGLPHAQRDSND